MSNHPQSTVRYGPYLKCGTPTIDDIKVGPDMVQTITSSVFLIHLRIALITITRVNLDILRWMCPVYRCLLFEKVWRLRHRRLSHNVPAQGSILTGSTFAEKLYAIHLFTDQYQLLWCKYTRYILPTYLYRVHIKLNWFRNINLSIKLSMGLLVN